MKHYEHIIVPKQIRQDLAFSPRDGRRGHPSFPNRNRAEHAAYLERKFETLHTESENLRTATQAASLPSRTGTYLEFSSAPAFDLATKSIEGASKGVRLLNVRKKIDEQGKEQTLAMVYVPHGQESFYLEKLNKYATEETDKGNPKYNALFRGIEDVKLALLQALWTDKKEDFPTEHQDWYEVWIRVDEKEKDDRAEQLGSFFSTLKTLNIQCKADSLLHFPERSVLLIYANRAELQQLLSCSDQLAELRCGRVLTSFIFDQNRSGQKEWVDELKDRVVISSDDANAVVCVLDTGVNNGHPLLEDVFPDENCDDVVGEGTADREGHGTAMCGVATYGDLNQCLASNQPIEIANKMSSVKLQPRNRPNPKEAWGALTEQAVSVSEVLFPKKQISYCMALTAEESDLGVPTSWSGAVDAMAYHEGEGHLFLISAGNIGDINGLNKETIAAYPTQNQLRKIQNPAQAWNSLTVGAYTDIVAAKSKALKGKPRVAPKGGISPFTRTSVLWDKKALIKPEVLFEGGNLYRTGDAAFPFSQHEDLEVRTTNKNFEMGSYFDGIDATSAATALAANFAGRLQARYPNLWPESIRGLMVHSAKWTPAMEAQFPVENRTDAKKKRTYMAIRLRHCGYGVPSEERAFYSTENGFTYIAQEVIQPFIKKTDGAKINEMHFFELPWPKEVLESLADVPVAMRITLSYFIEPAPGEIGWKDKYTYASCGLRFDVNNVNEDERAFKIRINKAIELEEHEERLKNDSNRWLIGSDNRNKGSIHSDALHLTAAELMDCNLIAVYPVGGWWKTRENLKMFNKKMKYALIVSLDTPAQEVDLYNVVKTKVETVIKTPVKVEIPIDRG